jgi:hypothetical protein
VKRTYRFVEPSGSIACAIDAEAFEIPVFAGILKHPTIEQLRVLLVDPVVVRKYTCEALRKAPWAALRRFPPSLLRRWLDDADMRRERRAALAFLLDS